MLCNYFTAPSHVDFLIQQLMDQNFQLVILIQLLAVMCFLLVVYVSRINRQMNELRSCCNYLSFKDSLFVKYIAHDHTS